MTIDNGTTRQSATVTNHSGCPTKMVEPTAVSASQGGLIWSGAPGIGLIADCQSVPRSGAGSSARARQRTRAEQVARRDDAGDHTEHGGDHDRPQPRGDRFLLTDGGEVVAGQLVQCGCVHLAGDRPITLGDRARDRFPGHPQAGPPRRSESLDHLSRSRHGLPAADAAAVGVDSTRMNDERSERRELEAAPGHLAQQIAERANQAAEYEAQPDQR